MSAPELLATYPPPGKLPEFIALEERLVTLHAIGRDVLAVARSARERGEREQWDVAMHEHSIVTDEIHAAMRELIGLVWVRSLPYPCRPWRTGPANAASIGL